jgi:uncharacterized protein with HEPN domain
MQRDDGLYLGHMLDMARKAAAKVRNLTRPEYDGDENLRLALVHLIQTIGEAAAHASKDTQNAHPEIPWRQVVGIRHRIVHDYMSVDFDIVWAVATRDLPELIAVLEPLVPPADA